MPETTGQRAEDIAKRFLERKGLDFIAANWRSRFGEIDLIFREDEVIVLVEVRLRTNTHFGGAAESIHAHKRARLLAAARQYLARFPRAVCRFDAVLLTRLDPPEIEWIRDAIAE
ncbi:MAG: YraN family protein [Burkholderiales bacterium]